MKEKVGRRLLFCKNCGEPVLAFGNADDFWGCMNCGEFNRSVNPGKKEEVCKK